MDSFPSGRGRLFSTLARGFFAGTLAALAMLVTMGATRLLLGWATPTELIFDRLFPLLPINVFIDSLVFFGGYTPLKLAGVAGSLAAQVLVGGLAGTLYALVVESRRVAAERRGGGAGPGGSGRLVLVGVLGVWAVSIALLWPTLLTHYHGLPPGPARVATSAGLLAAYAVCGLAVMFFYWLLAQPRAFRFTTPADRRGGASRRTFLAMGLGAGLAVALGGLLRRLFSLGTFAYDGREYGGPKVQRITPITPEDEFYQVSKNLVDPAVKRDGWRLDIVGQVETPRAWNFEELTALPGVSQETTILCISYRVGGGLCSNALWRGIPLPELLTQAKPKAGVTTVLFHASDGYYETFPFAKAMEPTTLVAYGMNGEPLPDRHGFPLRLVVPGLYGEKSPKWLTRIELLTDDDARLTRPQGCGFYKEQGWGPNFIIPTTSRFDAPMVTGDHFEQPFLAGKRAELRGMAFGGDRGVSRVELSLDDGATWQEAPITQPGTKLSWGLWAFAWTPAQPGEFRLIVRATDGEGKPQVAEERGPVPQGATGLHKVKASVTPA